MRRFTPAFLLAALASLIGTAPQTPAQTSAPMPAPQPVKAAPAWLGSADTPPAGAVAQRPLVVHYFSLEHRTVDQMTGADRTLLQSRRTELARAAEIFGYDLSAANWSVDQAICPALPGTLMLHYRARDADGSESRFTALVPRDRTPIRIVPTLHNNAATFLPAVKDARNYGLFNQVMPPEAAKQAVDPSGKWLVYAVCYAEMVGAHPNVPDDPGLDIALVHAPPSTFRMNAEAKTRQIQFPDREGAGAYSVWTLSLDGAGRITAAAVTDASTFTPQVVKLQEPAGHVVPAPVQPVAKIIVPTDQPKVTVSNPPAAPNR